MAFARMRLLRFGDRHETCSGPKRTERMRPSHQPPPLAAETHKVKPGISIAFRGFAARRRLANAERTAGGAAVVGIATVCRAAPTASDAVEDSAWWSSSQPVTTRAAPTTKPSSSCDDNGRRIEQKNRSREIPRSERSWLIRANPRGSMPAPTSVGWASVRECHSTELIREGQRLTDARMLDQRSESPLPRSSSASRMKSATSRG